MLVWRGQTSVMLRHMHAALLGKWQPGTCYSLTFGKSRELSFLTARGLGTELDDKGFPINVRVSSHNYYVQ